ISSANIDYVSRQPAVVDIDHAEPGRPRLEVHGPADLRELDAGGWRRQHRERAALNHLLAVHVTADQPADLGMTTEERHQVRSVAQLHRVHPRVAERPR